MAKLPVDHQALVIKAPSAFQPGGTHGVAARRVIIRARKGVASPLQILPGLVLHEADGRYTADAANVLNGGALEI